MDQLQLHLGGFPFSGTVTDGVEENKTYASDAWPVLIHQWSDGLLSNKFIRLEGPHYEWPVKTSGVSVCVP